MEQVLIYRGTGNLGDAIQTVALSRLLGGELLGVYRDVADRLARPGVPFIVNGWLGDAPAPAGVPCTFAGVYLGRRVEEQLRWLGRSGGVVGSRDLETDRLLAGRGIRSETVGCATLTFERYAGPRAGRYVVDADEAGEPGEAAGPEAVRLTHFIAAGLPWPRQWAMALERLEALRRAELVYTNRLHVVLPCLAFGTPVVLRRRWRDAAFQPARLAMLDELGFGYDQPFTADVSDFAERYVRFLSAALNREVKVGEPRMPVPPRQAAARPAAAATGPQGASPSPANPTSPAGPAAAIAEALRLHRSGRPAEAEAVYRAVLARDPGNPDAMHLLGMLAHECGRHRDGEVLMRRSIALAPGVPDFHNNLGALLQRTRRPREAAAELRQAIALRPGYAEAYNNLGAALEACGDGDAAADAYRRATELCPGYAGAYSNLSAALEWLGRPEAATECRRRLIDSAPDDAQAHSDLLTGLHYHADDPEALFAEHLRWAERHEAPLREKLRAQPGGLAPHDNDPGPDRPLRVGYVSPDLRAHPVVRFFGPLLAGRDRTRFTAYCYSDVGRPDPVTRRLREQSDGWRDIRGMPHDAVADLVRRDKIDVLVDLCGHMPENRLLLFARKPAPVQVTCIGYPDTTGMRSMDWRLTDADHDPPGLTDRYHTEKLARIEGGMWCYDPDPQGPAVNDLPALSKPAGAAGPAPFTFGMINRLVKITADMARLWARIVRAVPGSRLLLLAGGRGDLQPSTRNVLRQADFPWERLMTAGRRPRVGYLSLFHRIDLALDTYPYAGQTTTCDALWMGVPTVTLAGRTHVSRTGVCILNSVGLGEFVAQTPEQYVRIAVEAAKDLPRLADLRRALRPRMEQSPLRDPARLARAVETLYQHMWRAWCEGEGRRGKVSEQR